MIHAHLLRLRQAAAARQPVAYAVRLANGAAFVLPDIAAPANLAQAAATALAADRTGIVEIDGESWFIEARNPAPRLVIVGAVHIAQALAPLAVAAGFDVTVIDPRTGFAAPERFPGVRIDTAWPDEALATLQPDARTAIVTLTHDPKLDDPALVSALHSDAFYIGALGSTRTHARRLERLRDAGFDDAACARIAAPVGLDIGARTAPEIAISVIAEVIGARRGKRRERSA
jgi:xanthine dehydrogenase accessory factor